MLIRQEEIFLTNRMHDNAGVRGDILVALFLIFEAHLTLRKRSISISKFSELFWYQRAVPSSEVARLPNWNVTLHFPAFQAMLIDYGTI